jgi:hypothetical protein
MRARFLVKLLSNAKALTQDKPLKTRDLLLVVMAVARGNPENAWENRKDRKPDPGLVFSAPLFPLRPPVVPHRPLARRRAHLITTTQSNHRLDQPCVGTLGSPVSQITRPQLKPNP